MKSKQQQQQQQKQLLHVLLSSCFRYYYYLNLPHKFLASYAISAIASAFHLCLFSIFSYRNPA